MLKKKTMKQIQRMLILITVLMIALYGLNRLMLYRSYDRSVPEITFDKEFLEVSVDATEEKLLEGVKAVDKKDGDVTDTVIIESISKMLEDNQRIITYAAFDGDYHVGKAERRIQYTDYKSPRFSLKEELNVSTINTNMADVISSLKVIDCIDGDISNQIVVMGTEIMALSGEEASVQCEVRVTNSCGDVASLKLPVKINLTGVNSGYGKVELKEYLIYTKVGKSVDLRSYIKNSDGEVKIETDLDTSTPGVYTATYTTTVYETKVSTQLYIVVEE